MIVSPCRMSKSTSPYATSGRPRHAAVRNDVRYLNSLQASTSEPQYSMHLARSIGPLPTTFANRKSATDSISRGCSVAGGIGQVAQFLQLGLFHPVAAAVAVGQPIERRHALPGTPHLIAMINLSRSSLVVRRLAPSGICAVHLAAVSGPAVTGLAVALLRKIRMPQPRSRRRAQAPAAPPLRWRFARAEPPENPRQPAIDPQLGYRRASPFGPAGARPRTCPTATIP